MHRPSFALSVLLLTLGGCLIFSAPAQARCQSETNRWCVPFADEDPHVLGHESYPCPAHWYDQAYQMPAPAATPSLELACRDPFYDRMVAGSPAHSRTPDRWWEAEYDDEACRRRATAELGWDCSDVDPYNPYQSYYDAPPEVYLASEPNDPQESEAVVIDDLEYDFDEYQQAYLDGDHPGPPAAECPWTGNCPGWMPSATDELAVADPPLHLPPGVLPGDPADDHTVLVSLPNLQQLKSVVASLDQDLLFDEFYCRAALCQHHLQAWVCESGVEHYYHLTIKAIQDELIQRRRRDSHPETEQVTGCEAPAYSTNAVEPVPSAQSRVDWSQWSGWVMSQTADLLDDTGNLLHRLSRRMRFQAALNDGRIHR